MCLFHKYKEEIIEKIPFESYTQLGMHHEFNKYVIKRTCVKCGKSKIIFKRDD
jgi:hypothetical protein